jgi:hypothetical protein
MGIKLDVSVETPPSDDDRDLLAGISVMVHAIANLPNLADQPHMQDLEDDEGLPRHLPWMASPGVRCLIVAAMAVRATNGYFGSTPSSRSLRRRSKSARRTRVARASGISPIQRNLPLSRASKCTVRIDPRSVGSTRHSVEAFHGGPWRHRTRLSGSSSSSSSVNSILSGPTLSTDLHTDPGPIGPSLIRVRSTTAGT